ncbi:DUF3576 domain-containing protein [Mangrovicoccus ximenensis]|uniref:DUF3576 domain-containing protein n=1 Tax=Mangrovicoccus ximenensis TaxID=1911570 RepID=UPI000D346BA9|nr:DUF3576 domain-containing protein [Mangrovicoccus ximenensis]
MGWAAKSFAAALCAIVLAGCANEGKPVVEDPRGNNLLDEGRETVFDLFGADQDPNVTLEVNRYIWNASLEVLSFMPIRSVDPFSGLIVYDYGTPPGGGTSYRATVHVKDPALDARSLNLSLATRSGPAAPDTVRKVEDAILTRARQLRIADNNL